MAKETNHSIRAAAVSCAVGAAATTIGGIAVQAIVQPATAVPDDRWSYPWSSSALVPISIGLMAASALILARTSDISWMAALITIVAALLATATRLSPL